MHTLGMFTLHVARQCRYHYGCRLKNGFTMTRHTNYAYFATNKRPLTSSTSSKEEFYEGCQGIFSLVGRIMALFGVAYSVSEYGFELTLCEGPSMLPTIKSSGEIILVDRISPRLHGIEGGAVGIERTKFARKRQDEFEESFFSNNEKKNYQWHQPIVPVTDLPISDKWHRLWKQTTSGISVGDVVVVQHPDRKGTICKRVLGLPGDTVVKPPISMRRRPMLRRDLIRRNGLLVIPDGHIWVEGDNTMNSADSRNYGSIPAAMIVGRVLLRVWPLRGNAIMQRGARPRSVDGVPFTGSTIIPAGYEGEEIIKVP